MKLYYRDKSGVMRAIPGLDTYGPDLTIFVSKSVYTLSRSDAGEDNISWMFVVK